MNILCTYILSWLLFYLLPVNEGSHFADVEENVTLPCKYDTNKYGKSGMCWGRAELPASKCSNTIISTDGDKVTFRQSDRYQLLRGVMEGDVSLTIINVTENDSGIYGCRVVIPGPFNDLKQIFNLIIRKGLRRSQKNKCRSAHLDHSALDVQVTN
ncbi:hypothetical protein AAFF_G00320110 [Aldrovandia affinis]|uniref:Ig-like domain-containing protein n=1 Tax=Aldrovandia affinis TaxID=143900 RepID=A0AAD7WQR3_9TELE|nr:hypothetical protein AAFF_G00320110 [Aldrovandia affinis]